MRCHGPPAAHCRQGFETPRDFRAPDDAEIAAFTQVFDSHVISVTRNTDSQRRVSRLARSIVSSAAPPTRSSTPSRSIHGVEAPVLARWLSWWCTGGATMFLVVDVCGLVCDVVVVVVPDVVPDVVVVTGVVVDEVVDQDVVDVEVDGLVVDEVSVDDVVVVVVDVVVEGFVCLVFEVVVGVDDDGGSSPRGDGARQSGRSCEHHAAAHTWPSPEAAASGAAPCSATTVNTAPAASTPI
ncbi:hypothetical protein SAMN05421507_101416 [Lentzea jiangxiensis]|uniref:Uncharacterized protein n=2 Tax=Lentzea jiangxiensis TaxID=641025 RepID=A0A1H0EKY7_9PSEU|nr:hypothetical protein SAMN05421507_101416 [Lentzea jiangxiensis]